MGVAKVKFCGMRRLADIEAANALLPEYVGFVFAPSSRRRVSPEEALALRRRLVPGIRAVGVFANETPEKIASLVGRGAIDIAQLHGAEDAADVLRVRELSGAPVIQAFKVRCADDLRRAGQSPADYILLDAGAGEGRAFDWTLLAECRPGRPFFLAGGLTPENVADAVRSVAPFAVDASSGLEADGAKDVGKMTRFIRAVRSIAP
ncbi:MAG: phosphoribosylanthranilate isomerase [Kiritimatiellae bacterium]|nr:phosphoribosylanthranilate isomerase [Kiritimatiellia bacterium]